MFNFCYMCASWLSLSAAGYSVAEECPGDGVRIKAEDPNPFDTFGIAVGISGNTAVVGADRDAENGPESGAGYVFVYNSRQWVQAQKLSSSDIEPNDELGRAVGVDGETNMVAALQHLHNDASGNGSVYAFCPQRSDWVETQELLASDGGLGDGFGWSLAISGNTTIIGAPIHDHGGGFGSGSAYVFRFGPATPQWIEETELTASDSALALNFGLSVALSGDVALIGAPGDSSACPADPFSQSGAAYIFRHDREREGWYEQQKLLASDGACLDDFGWDVGVSGDTALIGAQFHDDNGTNSGAVYVFRFDPERSQWVEQQKLLASDGLPGDQFGRALAIDGDLAVIGAWKADAVNENSGAAYVFRRNALGVWVEQCKLLPLPNAWTQRFGWSVDIDCRRVIIGADGEDQQQGAAYIFELSSSPADLNGDCDVGAFDLAQLLAMWGPCPRPCEPGDPAQTCLADLNADCTVGPTDLAMLLGSWG